METNSKIYIAGHRGMVGSATLRALERQGFSNIIVKTRKELDLLDQQRVNDFFKHERPEYVIDAAARVGGIKDSMEHHADFLYENLQIQNNIIWASHRHDVKKLLFLGSSCIYPLNAPQPMREEYLLTGKLEPTNAGYSIAKIAGIALCEKIYEQYNKPFISCMPTNIYGEGDNFNPSSSHVIPGLMHRMYKAKENNESEIIVWGSGTSRREFLYVDDLADAIIFLMNSYEGKEFLNVGTGIDVSIRELAEHLKKVTGFTGKLIFDTSKPDGMPKKLLDVSKLSKLGWQSSTSLDEGLIKTYSWFLENIAKRM